jgi:hypothetical protein
MRPADKHSTRRTATPKPFALFLGGFDVKIFGTILFVLAIAAGLDGAWCATAVLWWTAFEAWTFNDDVLEAIALEDEQ